MIDIHTHIIPSVDDGCKTIDEALMMIAEEIKQGVKEIICTPHYRAHMFTSSKENIKQNFYLLQQKIKENNLPVNIYLGQEVFLHNEKEIKTLLQEERILIINQKYILIEFDYYKKIDINEIVYNISLYGYIPIIAHIERYEYVDLNSIMELKQLGALIQMNASSVIGLDGKKSKKKSKKYIQADVIDFIATDIHFQRINYIEKAYKYIEKKFGEQKAIKLFKTNATDLIKIKSGDD